VNALFADSAPLVPPELLGPLGLTVGIILVLVLGYREVWVFGTRLKKAEEALAKTLDLLKEATDSNKTMAAAMEERNKLDTERLRMAQAGLLDSMGDPVNRRR
jgi:hypothetical protein